MIVEIPVQHDQGHQEEEEANGHRNDPLVRPRSFFLLRLPMLVEQEDHRYADGDSTGQQ